MFANRKMHEKMNKLSRTLLSGSASAAQRYGPGADVPDFVKDLLTQLGVRAPAQESRVAPNLHGAKTAAWAAPSTAGNAPSQGRFLTKSLINQAGKRDYKLYIPGSYDGRLLPMVVMLHGCSQSPDDFANGTRMNQLAEEMQFFVVYPAQAHAANSSNCWNWFKSEDQQRGQGEPALIAGITREVASSYQIDTDKVYVAGLSSGGAMAIIMATTYPELYAGVGVHSGLPYASASDLPSAFAAMRGTGRDTHFNNYFQNPPQSETPCSPIPIIVFHGDCDTTVSVRNGERLMQQNTLKSGAGIDAGADVIVEQGQVPDGHRYTCTSHHGTAGQILA